MFKTYNVLHISSVFAANNKYNIKCYQDYTKDTK